MLYGVERSTDYNFVLSQSTRLTERQTDGQMSIARTCVRIRSRTVITKHQPVCTLQLMSVNSQHVDAVFMISATNYKRLLRAVILSERSPSRCSKCIQSARQGLSVMPARIGLLQPEPTKSLARGGSTNARTTLHCSDVTNYRIA